MRVSESAQNNKEPEPEKGEEKYLPPTIDEDRQDQLDTVFGFKTELPKETPRNAQQIKKEKKPKKSLPSSDDDEYFGARVIH